MDAKAIILAAVMFGAIGGYAWSSLGAPAAPVAARAKATMVALPPSPEELPAAEDREWTARSDDSAPAATGPDQSVYYAGCNAVRAAGKAPLYAGQPGYRSAMDGDGDGIACEPHRSF